MFNERKDAILGRSDQSKKGTVDDEIRPLLTLINSFPHMYTTSSCAGRIVLMVEPPSQKKKDTRWLYVSHKTAEAYDIIDKLENPPSENVWLKMEPFILHLAVQKIEQADDLLEILVSVGLKHSGILTTRKRIMLEIIGNERLDVPVSTEGKLLASIDHIKFIVKQANIKLEKNKARVQRLYEALEKF